MARQGKFSRDSGGKKGKTLKRILLAILLLLLLLAGLVVWYVWSKLSLIQYADEISTAPTETVSATEETEEEQLVDISGLEISETEPIIPDAEIRQEDAVTNILLIGTDERSKTFSTNARSDSMIIVSINRDENTVKLVSLERGMGVPILAGEYEGQYDWLTHVFRYGGADLLVETVEYCFRVEIDNYIRVNFTTVTETVDAIGGIDIEMTASEVNYLNAVYQSNPSANPSQGTLTVGVNHINGTTALALSRLRAIDSDWQRVERQRRVITACMSALKDSSLAELNNLLDQVLPLVQTDLTMLEIADWMLYSPNLLSADIEQMTIPQEGTYGGMVGMGGRNLYAVDFETNSQILQEFLYGASEE